MARLQMLDITPAEYESLFSDVDETFDHFCHHLIPLMVDAQTAARFQLLVPVWDEFADMWSDLQDSSPTMSQLIRNIYPWIQKYWWECLFIQEQLASDYSMQDQLLLPHCPPYLEDNDQRDQERDQWCEMVTSHFFDGFKNL